MRVIWGLPTHSSNVRCCTCTTEIVLMRTMDLDLANAVATYGKTCMMWVVRLYRNMFNKAGQVAAVKAQLQTDHIPADASA